MGVRPQLPRGSAAARDIHARDERLREIELMTVPEVATFLRTSPKAIYTMIERGQLPGVLRIGRRVLVDRRALVDWLGQKATPSLEQVGQR
jgi:excisionase family DNA binding protein